MDWKQRWMSAPSRVAGYAARAPVEVLVCAVGAFAASMTVEALDLSDGAATSEAWLRVFMGAAMAGPAVAALTVVHAMGRLSALARFAGSAVVVALAMALAQWGFEKQAIASWFWWGVLQLASNSLLLLAPFAAGWSTEEDRERWWWVVWRLLQRVLLVGLFGTLWSWGLMAAWGSIDVLFSLDVTETVYAHLQIWVSVGLVPWIAAGGVDAVVAPPPDSGPSRVSNVLTRMVLMPLLLIYLAILYAYLVKVALQGGLPANVISPLLTGAGVLGWVATLSTRSAREQAEGTWTWKVVRAFPAMYLPLVPIGLYAIWQRVEQHGWTEFRHLRFVVLLALGAFALEGLVRWVRGWPLPQAGAVGVMALALGLSAVGPLSAVQVSWRSQAARLETQLATVGWEPGGQIDLELVRAAGPQGPYDDSLGGLLRSEVVWLVDHFGVAPVAARLGYAEAEVSTQEGLVEAMGLSGVFGVDVESRMFRYSVRTVNGAPIGDGRLYEIRWWDTATWQDPDAVTVRVEGGLLTLEREGVVTEIYDISAFVDALETRITEYPADVRESERHQRMPAEMVIPGPAGGTLLVQDLTWNIAGPEHPATLSDLTALWIATPAPE